MLLLVVVAGCARTEPWAERLPVDDEEDGGLQPAGEDAAAGGDVGPRDAAMAGLDAGAVDAADPTRDLIGAITYRDVDGIAGNPRKVSLSTVQATDLDNEVELKVQPLREPLTYQWGTSHGAIGGGVASGPVARFRAATQGVARISCRATLTATGETQERVLEVVVKRALRTGPLLRGEWVVYTLWPGFIEALHLPTGRMVEVGKAGLASFDGATIAAKPPSLGNKEIELAAVSDFRTLKVKPATLQQSWDYRHIHVSGDRLFWATSDRSYSVNSLYTQRIAESSETLLHGPALVVSAAASAGRLAFTAGDNATPRLYRNFVWDPVQKSRAQPQLDALGAVQSWKDPWMSLIGTGGVTVTNLSSGKSFAVSRPRLSTVSVDVGERCYGGHAREPFGTKGEVFLATYDGAVDRAHPLGTNEFVTPSVDGCRMAFAFGGKVFLLEAP